MPQRRYCDQDGTASKRSQSDYDAEIRSLQVIIAALSWLGLATSLSSSRSETNRSESTALWCLVTCHSCIIYFVRQPLTVYRLGIQGAVFVTAVLLLSLRTRLEDGFQIGHVSEILIGIVLIAAQLCIRRVPLLYTETGLAVDHEVSSSILAKMSMNWCKESLQMAGNHGGISLLPALNYATRSRSQPNIQSSCGHLWTQGFTQRRNCFVEQWVLTLARTFLAFGSPYCILQMIRCLEQGTTDNAWAWLFAVGVSSVCDTIVHYQQAWIQWSELGIPIRAQLLHALYRKLLRNGNGHEDQPEKLSTASSKTLPTVTTLMSTDSLGISKFVAVHYIFPLSILKFIIAMVFITRLLGWRGFIVTTLVTVASIPINSSVVRAERLAQRDLRRARDNKDKIASEMLNALRHIKLQATEDLWKTRMKESRSQELKALQRLLLTQNLRAAWKVASPLFVAAASIFTYSYFEGEITASLIFTVLELLPHLQGTLATAPLVIQDYLSAMSHTRRVSSFLGAPDHEMYLEHSRSGDIVVKEASIEWPRGVGSPSTAKCAPPSFELRGVNLDFPSGELSIIHGATGSGKSLLISAILGEARLVEGSIEAPCAQHGSPVGFVAQTPWLQDTSIKDNILFGSPLDPIRYKNVLEACDLMPDLAALPRSDDTLVGVKGVKMSGGQRARIAAARALYSHAQTIILDDVLSALDARVASHVFDALNGPLGKGRTLILATHHIDLCSPRANYIVHVHENTARATDLKAPAVQQHMRPSHKGVHCDPSCVPSRLTTATSTPSSLRHPEKEDEKEPSMKPSPSDRNSGNQWACLRTYLKACGGLQFISSFVVALALKQFSSTIPTWILKDFKTTQSASLDEDPTHNTFQYHARLYGISLLFAVTMEFSFNTLTSTGTMKASTLLFDSMLDKVIHMPLQWLDNVQVGELMQIFSTDSQNVDDKLITTVSDFACCSGEALSIILVGLSFSSYTGLLVLAGLYTSFSVGKLYTKARKTIQRADRAPTTQILQHTTTSLSGLATIRAFGATERFSEEMHDHIDQLSKARRYFWIANRWLGLQISLIGIAFTMGTGIILLYSGHNLVDPALFGFVFTFSTKLSGICFKVVNSFGAFESSVAAAEKIIACANLEPEYQDGEDAPSDWPLTGKIEVRNLAARYSDTLPFVLDNINFTVEPGQRIGIVGRTGAGKSTLALSLLRLIQVQQGTIHIDGLDISTLRLDCLRSKIGFIPQDPALFSGTIRSNLDPARRHADSALENSLRRVRLKLSLDSSVEIGGNTLSHGQRQLLCLARLFLEDHKIIILDEATSAVDNEADMAIQDMLRFSSQQTLIVIAHRLQTVATFEKFLVMEDGKVTEQGSPYELLKAKGAYWRLVVGSVSMEQGSQAYTDGRTRQRKKLGKTIDGK